VKINGSVASIVLSGGIDYAAQEEFKSANQQALTAKGVTEIRVDFANANFLDSSGIRALLLLQKEADQRGKSVFLMHCDKRMREIFEIGGFDKVFHFK
jgi:anti-anti-sigma factor